MPKNRNTLTLKQVFHGPGQYRSGKGISVAPLLGNFDDKGLLGLPPKNTNTGRPSSDPSTSVSRLSQRLVKQKDFLDTKSHIMDEDEEDSEDNEKQNEMSSLAGGSISGYTLPLGMGSMTKKGRKKMSKLYGDGKYDQTNTSILNKVKRRP